MVLLSRVFCLAYQVSDSFKLAQPFRNYRKAIRRGIILLHKFVAITNGHYHY